MTQKMTRQQQQALLREAMQQHDLDYLELGKLMGISWRSAQSWMTGGQASARNIPGPAVLILHFLASGKLKPSDLRKAWAKIDKG